MHVISKLGWMIVHLGLETNGRGTSSCLTGPGLQWVIGPVITLFDYDDDDDDADDDDDYYIYIYIYIIASLV